jgi:ABC-type antimicrobial peptide transport system permease subunit
MQPTIYMPLSQWDLAVLFDNFSISIRSEDGLSAMPVRAVADALTRVRGDISFRSHSLKDQVNASLARESAIAKLSIWFGMMALLLASIGLYGVMSHAVSRSGSEIGIRIALGATPNALIRMVFCRAYLLVALGITIGVVASFWASRLVASLLYEIDAHNTLVLVVSTFVLIIAATAAVWLPAARASRTDPAVVLRSN